MDCISGLDWVEIWHWFYWYYTGYAGLVSQMYIECTHTHTKQSNRFDRLYITSHEWIHTNSFTHTNLCCFFFLYPFSFILPSNTFFPSHTFSFFYSCTPLLLCAIMMAWHSWHFWWSPFLSLLYILLYFPFCCFFLRFFIVFNRIRAFLFGVLFLVFIHLCQNKKC